MKIVNNHIKIKPVEHTEFISSSKGLYEEMGIVLDKADNIDIPIGAVVYFDSWLAKKYPVVGNSEESIWFVNYADIVAYDNAPLPK